MKKIWFVLVTLTLISCGTTKNQPNELMNSESTETEVEEPSVTEETIKVNSEIGSFEESDPLDIDSAYVIGNKLFLHIRYGGGCKDHSFKLIGSPMVMKSMPPKRSIQLYHNSNQDLCKAIVPKILEVDLKNIAYQQVPGSEIIFILKGYKNEIKYTYQ